MVQCYYIEVEQGSVAQWLEQGTHKPKVVGSNPTRAIYFLLIRQSLKRLNILI